MRVTITFDTDDRAELLEANLFVNSLFHRHKVMPEDKAALGPALAEETPPTPAADEPPAPEPDTSTILPTMAELQALASEKIKAHGIDFVRGALEKVGADKLSNLKNHELIAQFVDLLNEEA